MYLVMFQHLLLQEKLRKTKINLIKKLLVFRQHFQLLPYLTFVQKFNKKKNY